MAKRKYKRLHYEDRQTIEAMSKQGSSVSDIAEALGTHRDTIYREFKRCNARVSHCCCMSFHKWQRMQITHLWSGNISQYPCSMQAGLGMR